MTRERLAVSIHGAVQGVGFRPFVYRLATNLRLPGWVSNGSQGVLIEVEGHREALERFLLRLDREQPPLAIVQGLEFSFLDPVGFTGFEIRHSNGDGARTVLLLPDIAPCAECLREVADPADRRYRYPFTNCTNCGPRFTVVEDLPYDRAGTTMRHFPMCRACAGEYADPADRRFHAQPNACPCCGPRVEMWGPGGERVAREEEALRQAADSVRCGQIVAVKGLGGFLLVADAKNEAAVQRLRDRKARVEKPFALLFPDLASVRACCEVGDMEARLLAAPEAPIVLLRRLASPGVAPSVAPGNPCLGVMLPSTPLHKILMDDLRSPVVATSGNRTDEPICADERVALRRLGKVADAYLVHNRPIARHCDDSVVRVAGSRQLVLRRARGYAPLPVRCAPLGTSVPPILAVGGHLKNTVTLTVGDQAFVSQHVGDLGSPEARDAFEQVVADLLRLHGVRPSAVAHDLHPDYASTAWAERNLPGIPRIPVQHHHAHLAACLAENEVAGPALGVTWDGSGYGLDGTVWGGEFLLGTATRVRRVARLRTFPLPGGERAVEEPRRSALGMLFAMLGKDLWRALRGERLAELPGPPLRELACLTSFGTAELPVLERMLRRSLNCPETSSAGRLFDAVAGLLALRQRSSFEGQAAMDLEFAAGQAGGRATDRAACRAAGVPGVGAYPMAIRPGPVLVVDWEPLVRSVLRDVCDDVPVAHIAARFHNALADILAGVAERVGCERVALTGGVFQNRILAERASQRLSEAGFRVYTHQRVPPNDGGISLGQAAVAAARLARMEGGGRVPGCAG